MLLTAQQIIDQSLKLCGILGDGTLMTSQEYTDCLLQLNLMIDRWNLVDLLVYSTNPHTFSFISGKQYYTLGTGGDFDMPRPAKVDRISIQYAGTSNSGIPVEMPIDQDFDLEHWQSLMVKNIPSIFPVICYNNTGFPFMNLGFWPIPQGPASVILYTWDLMPFIVNLIDIVELPTGYTDAIINNLALRLCQMFDRQPSQQLVSEAAQSKHEINDINAGTPTLHIDGMWLGNDRTGSTAAQTIGRVVF